MKPAFKSSIILPVLISTIELIIQLAKNRVTHFDKGVEILNQAKRKLFNNSYYHFSMVWAKGMEQLFRDISQVVDDTLRFMKNKIVPFTKNLSENDIQMNKVQQKNNLVINRKLPC